MSRRHSLLVRLLPKMTGLVIDENMRKQPSASVYCIPETEG